MRMKKIRIYDIFLYFQFCYGFYSNEFVSGDCGMNLEITRQIDKDETG